MKVSLACWILAAAIAAGCLPAVGALRSACVDPNLNRRAPPNAEIALGRWLWTVYTSPNTARLPEPEVWAVFARQPQYAALVGDLRAHLPFCWRRLPRHYFEGAPGPPTRDGGYRRAAELLAEFAEFSRQARSRTPVAVVDCQAWLDRCEALVGADIDDHRTACLRAMSRYLEWCGTSIESRIGFLLSANRNYQLSLAFAQLEQILRFNQLSRVAAASRRRLPPPRRRASGQEFLALRSGAIAAKLRARLGPQKALPISDDLYEHTLRPQHTLSQLGRLLALAAVGLMAACLLSRSRGRGDEPTPSGRFASLAGWGLLGLVLLAPGLLPVSPRFGFEDGCLLQVLLLILALAFITWRRTRALRIRCDLSLRRRLWLALPFLTLALFCSLGFHGFLRLGGELFTQWLTEGPIVWAVVCMVTILVILAGWALPRSTGADRLRRLALVLTITATVVVGVCGISRGGDFFVSPLSALAWMAAWVVVYGFIVRIQGRRGPQGPVVHDWSLAAMLFAGAILLVFASWIAFPRNNGDWIWFEELALGVDMTALLCFVPALRGAWLRASPEVGQPSPETVGCTMACARTLCPGVLVLAVVVVVQTAYGHHLVLERTADLQTLLADDF